MNFLELCERNQGNLSSRFENLLNSADGATRLVLIEFAEVIKEQGRVGVNLRAMVLLDLLTTDRWLNIHQWAKKISIRGGKPIEEILREKLKGYFDLRMAFDGFFDLGLEFRYGALNIGGLAANRFGEYCAIFHKDMLSQLSLGYLKGDSLNHYMAPGPRVDEDLLPADCATEGSKHMLLTLKHGRSVPGRPSRQWPELVCNADCYAEVIVVAGDLGAAHLSCVRIENWISICIVSTRFSNAASGSRSWIVTG
jgi:hypothetical protein